MSITVKQPRAAARVGAGTGLSTGERTPKLLDLAPSGAPSRPT